MPAREYLCRLLELSWITPTVMHVKFEPSKRFSFDPGQFVSLLVPGDEAVRRAYSLAGEAGSDIYELCVKLLPGGKGSGYLASLKAGAEFRIQAPFGDFHYATRPGRIACFIATGTGIAPFRSIVWSKSFQKNPPDHALLIQGVRNQKEILYRGEFERRGVEVVYACSQPEGRHKGFTGRVTDYLKSLPSNWPWDRTDFYLCGNGEMVNEVRNILLRERGVAASAIFQEIYFTAKRSPTPFGQEAA